MLLQRHVLKLDVAGIPQDWIGSHEAAKLICEELVSWSLGGVINTLYGGKNRHGVRTIMEIPSIIAINRTADINLLDIPVPVSNDRLFIRDRNMCAYCGDVFHPAVLEAEHIFPDSREGKYSWMNLVAACHACNQRKRNRTPEEAGMPLLYLPYVPSPWEGMIMKSRNILADQHEFLMSHVPATSRLHH